MRIIIACQLQLKHTHAHKSMLRNTFQCILIEKKNKPDWAYNMTETEDTKYNATQSMTAINVLERDLVQGAFLLGMLNFC